MRGRRCATRAVDQAGLAQRQDQPRISECPQFRGAFPTATRVASNTGQRRRVALVDRCTRTHRRRRPARMPLLRSACDDLLERCTRTHTPQAESCSRPTVRHSEATDLERSRCPNPDAQRSGEFSRRKLGSDPGARCARSWMTWTSARDLIRLGRRYSNTSAGPSRRGNGAALLEQAGLRRR